MGWTTDVGLPLLDSALNFVGGILTNSANKKMTDKNIASVERMNSQNIAFQKAENDITRLREDNAVTRASIDMQNAGLSKTLAAGHPASAQALTAPSTQAPNHSYKYESALLKLNIADSLANYKLKVSEANKNDAQAKTLASQADMFDSSKALNESYTRLNQIVGDNKQREIDAEIAYTYQKIAESKSNIALNNEQILKYSYEIAESIAREYKLGLEARMLVYQITAQRLQNLTDSWNLSRNMAYGTPTNYSPSMIGKLGRDFAGGIDGLSGNDFYVNGLNSIMSGY